MAECFEEILEAWLDFKKLMEVEIELFYLFKNPAFQTYISFFRNTLIKKHTPNEDVDKGEAN